MHRSLIVLALSFLPVIALAADRPAQPPDPAPAIEAPTTVATPDAIAERLAALAPLFTLPAPALPESLLPKDGDACAVEVATVALLYRNDPDRWRERFFALLVIDDYAARGRKQYNLIGGEDVDEVFNGALGANPGVADDRMKAVVGFCELKRTQPFVMTRKGGMIALSRIARGLMLGSLLDGTDEDAAGIANAIDGHTQSLHPGLELPWEKPLE